MKFSVSPCSSTWRCQINVEVPSLNSPPNFPFIIQLYDDGVESTKKQLLTVCPGLQDAQPRLLEKLLSVWAGVRDRLFKHYHFAAKAYFMYLRMGAEVKVTEQNVIPVIIFLIVSMLWFKFILGLKFFELFSIFPDYGNECTTKENKN